MIYLTVIKANNKVFIKTSYKTYVSRKDYYFNNNLAKQSFHSDWKIVEEILPI